MTLELRLPVLSISGSNISSYGLLSALHLVFLDPVTREHRGLALHLALWCPDLYGHLGKGRGRPITDYLLFVVVFLKCKFINTKMKSVAFSEPNFE